MTPHSACEHPEARGRLDGKYTFPLLPISRFILTLHALLRILSD